MKKVALLISFMLIFTLASFAQIDVTVEGSSELTLGINLDDQFAEGDADAVATGFTNSNSSKISFSLNSGDSEKGAEEDVYGYIKIGGWCADYNSDDGWDLDAGDVEAKIITPNVWIKISGTNASVGNVMIVEGMDDDDTENEGIGTSLTNSGGLVIGASAGPASIELGVFSENDWTNDDNSVDAGAGSWAHNDDAATAVDVNDNHIYTAGADAVADTDDSNATNAYGVCLKASVAAGPITIDAGVVMGLTYPDGTPIGLTAKASGDVSIVSFYAAMDGEYTDALVWEVAAGLSASPLDGVSVSADVSYSEAEDLDLKVALSANGVVPSLNLGVTAWILNVQNAMSWLLDLEADYSLDTAKIYAAFGTGDDEVNSLNLGVELYVITNVTFVLDYESEDLANSNGVIKVITKIAY
jgi:hypothetical protein